MNNIFNQIVVATKTVLRNRVFLAVFLTLIPLRG